MSAMEILNPIQEEEVKINISWTADERTQAAIERQAALMGFDSPKEYLEQAIAAVLSANEQGPLP